MAAVITLYAYRAKSYNGNKAKAKNANFIGYFLETYCVTILPGIPEKNK